MGILKKILKDISGSFEQRVPFSCAGCMAQLAVSEKLRGRTTRCPKCSILLRVPGIPQDQLKPKLPRIVIKLPSPQQRKRDRLASRAQGEVELYEALHQVMADGVITADEEATLQEIAERYGLSPQSIHNAKAKYAKEAYRQVILDNRIDPDENLRIQQIAAALRLPLESIIGDSREYDRMRILAALDYGELPIVSTSVVLLKKGEACHYEDNAWLLGERSDTVFYSWGESYSVEICAGLDYTVGSFVGKPVTRHKITGVDHGTFSVTNQRLVFSGRKRTVSVPIESVATFKLYSDAIAINSEKAEETIGLRISDPELIGAILSNLLNRG
jgi:hypothetical protein